MSDYYALSRELQAVKAEVDNTAIMQGDQLADVQRDINRILRHLGLAVRHVPSRAFYEPSCAADCEDYDVIEFPKQPAA